MSLRELGWIIFLAGLPFAHLFFRPMEPWMLTLGPWQRQALWSEAWVVILFAAAVGSGVKSTSNRPLAALLCWIFLHALWQWATSIRWKQEYPIMLSYGIMHVALLWMAYWAAVSTWKQEWLSKLLRWMAWTGLWLLVYCGFQALNLDEFFVNLDKSQKTDILVGTLGNKSHLAVNLSLLLPLFWLQESLLWKVCFAVTLGLIAYLSSFGALIASLMFLGWLAFRTSGKWVVAWAIGVAAIFVTLIQFPEYWKDHGRLAAWQHYYSIFVKSPITGLGGGFVHEMSRQITDNSSPIFQWRHVHNEYLQWAIEYGLIGLGIILWMIKDIFSRLVELPNSRMTTALGGILVVFLVNCLLLYPAHLWVTGSYAFVAYCGVMVLSEGLMNGCAYDT